MSSASGKSSQTGQAVSSDAIAADENSQTPNTDSRSNELPSQPVTTDRSGRVQGVNAFPSQSQHQKMMRAFPPKTPFFPRYQQSNRAQIQQPRWQSPRNPQNAQHQFHFQHHHLPQQHPQHQMMYMMPPMTQPPPGYHSWGRGQIPQPLAQYPPNYYPAFSQTQLQQQQQSPHNQQWNGYNGRVENGSESGSPEMTYSIAKAPQLEWAKKMDWNAFKAKMAKEGAHEQPTNQSTSSSSETENHAQRDESIPPSVLQLAQDLLRNYPELARLDAKSNIHHVIHHFENKPPLYQLQIEPMQGGNSNDEKNGEVVEGNEKNAAPNTGANIPSSFDEQQQNTAQPQHATSGKPAASNAENRNNEPYTSSIEAVSSGIAPKVDETTGACAQEKNGTPSAETSFQQSGFGFSTSANHVDSGEEKKNDIPEAVGQERQTSQVARERYYPGQQKKHTAPRSQSTSGGPFVSNVPIEKNKSHASSNTVSSSATSQKPSDADGPGVEKKTGTATSERQFERNGAGPSNSARPVVSRGEETDNTSESKNQKPKARHMPKSYSDIVKTKPAANTPSSSRVSSGPGPKNAAKQESSKPSKSSATVSKQASSVSTSTPAINGPSTNCHSVSIPPVVQKNAPKAEVDKKKDKKVILSAEKSTEVRKTSTVATVNQSEMSMQTNSENDRQQTDTSGNDTNPVSAETIPSISDSEALTGHELSPEVERAYDDSYSTVVRSRPQSAMSNFPAEPVEAQIPADTFEEAEDQEPVAASSDSPAAPAEESEEAAKVNRPTVVIPEHQKIVKKQKTKNKKNEKKPDNDDDDIDAIVKLLDEQDAQATQKAKSKENKAKKEGQSTGKQHESISKTQEVKEIQQQPYVDEGEMDWSSEEHLTAVYFLLEMGAFDGKPELTEIHVEISNYLVATTATRGLLLVLNYEGSTNSLFDDEPTQLAQNIYGYWAERPLINLSCFKDKYHRFLIQRIVHYRDTQEPTEKKLRRLYEVSKSLVHKHLIEDILWLAEQNLAGEELAKLERDYLHMLGYVARRQARHRIQLITTSSSLLQSFVTPKIGAAQTTFFVDYIQRTHRLRFHGLVDEITKHKNLLYRLFKDCEEDNITYTHTDTTQFLIGLRTTLHNVPEQKRKKYRDYCDFLLQIKSVVIDSDVYYAGTAYFDKYKKTLTDPHQFLLSVWFND